MQLRDIPRTTASSLNPLIGPSAGDTMQNVNKFLDGQCNLIADRTPGTTLDGEMALYFLQAIGGAIRYETESKECGQTGA